MHRFSNGETPAERFKRLARSVKDFENPIMIDETMELIKELEGYGVDTGWFLAEVESGDLIHLSYCCAANTYANMFRRQFGKVVPSQRKAMQDQALENCQYFADKARKHRSRFISDAEISRLSVEPRI